jgi:hypothetical protein
MQAKGIVGYGNKVADSLWASNQTRSGVREHLLRKVKVTLPTSKEVKTWQKFV